MKITVPCNVSIRKFYRMYVSVDENASESEIVEVAKNKILEMSEPEFNYEMIPDPDLEIEEHDILGVEPCTDCTFECYDDEITKEMISRGIDIGIITFTNSPDDGSVVCKIGEYWFYFCGTFEMSEYGTIEPIEDLPHYLDGTSKAQKVDDIYTTLEDMRKEGWECEDEYDYYYEYLKENL